MYAERSTSVKSVKVAAVQFESSPNPTRNRVLLTKTIDAAAEAGAKLIILPEASQRAFGSNGASLAEDPESLEGPFVTMLVDRAARHALHIVAGMFETAEAPRLPFNTTVIAGPNGVVAAYRKIHLYDALGFVESEGVTGGSIGDDNLIVFEAHGFSFGVMTCFDLRFPEMTRALVDRGADVIVLGAAWVPGPRKHEQWRTLLEARAIESTAYVIAAGQPGPRYCGGSTIIAPDGSTIEEAPPDGMTMITGDLDRAAITTVRSSMPVLAQRRIGVPQR